MFRLDLLVKDVRLALELAREDGVPTPVGNAVAAAYEAALEAGLGDLDYSAIIRTPAGQARTAG
jgi:3-hydroxyisobutyrate dehydrogenase-like beta-hydroxyacid dehydrogenase